MFFFFLYHLAIFSLFSFSLTCTLQRGKSAAYLGYHPQDACPFGRLLVRRKEKRCAEGGIHNRITRCDTNCVKKTYLFAERGVGHHDELIFEGGMIPQGEEDPPDGKPPQKGELYSEEVDTKEKRFATVRSGVDRLLFVNRNLFYTLQEGGCLPIEGDSPVDSKKKKVQTDGKCPEEVEMLLQGMHNFHLDEERVGMYTDLIRGIVEQGVIPLEIVQSGGKVDTLDREIRNYVAMLLLRAGGTIPVESTPLEGDDAASGESPLKRKDHLRNVAKKLLLLKEAMVKLAKEHKIKIDTIYIDGKTGDVKVKRNCFEDGNEKRSNWKLIFLGTGSMYPSTNRGTSSFLLQTTKKKCNEAFLFDCGENTFIALQRASIKMSKIKNIFLTHLHGDHCLGIISVLTMLRNSNTINIYGPEGTHRFLRNTFSSTYSKRMAKFFVYEMKGGGTIQSAKMAPSPAGKSPIASLRKKRDDVEFLPPNEDNTYTVLRNDYLEILGFPIKHTVPTIGYIVRELNVESKFNAPYIDELIRKNYDELKKCEKLEFDPYKIYEHVIRKMNEGDVVVFPDKTQLTFGNAYKEIYRGRKIVICQDTYDASSLEKFATDADVLIHEATNSLIDLTDQGVAPLDGFCEDDVGRSLPSVAHAGEAVPPSCVSGEVGTPTNQDDTTLSNEKSCSKQMSPLLVRKYNKIIAERGHSTANMAGTFAKKINAKKLILTHFSQRYIGDNKLKNVAVMRRIEKEAEESFGGITQGESEDAPNTSNTTEPNCDGQKEVIAAYDGLTVYVPPQRVK
ncbi:Metallo-hydrolase/oxidoreductase [Plasmodium coatneyi]|uniref:Metallo-hydrolase/oxidoreductase n=1 Tax=Plasmodium coatneyi TaxID=208452 RepID=A0A1B1DTM8_9APIC|nr:Metallo-hydrolase/oxidoreductase [Plasmodium coatneyi]ANQ06138.1 Metallo-hydrolase/oxidoreductase [Plasmodium coatneyi]